MAFDSIFSSVAKGGSFTAGAAGITINDGRKKQVDFSSVYSRSTLVIVSKSNIKSLAALNNLSVAVQTGTSGDSILTQANSTGYTYTVKNPDGTESSETVKISADIKRWPDYDTIKLNLLNGQIHAVIMDKLPAESLFYGNSSVGIYPVAELPQEDFGIAVKKGNSSMTEAINEVIDLWLANGNMDKYIAYYSDLYEYENGGTVMPTAPAGLKLEWNC